MKAYYATFGEFEWERLEWADGAIEFEINTRLLERYLPADGRVLDLGGGPGRYAQWLADRGYRVTLADLSPELLESALRHVSSSLVDEITEADARDLSRWQDATFDAALIMGPLYHLPNESDRARAISEVLRVVRAGGMMFFALMPVFAFVRRTIAIPDERQHLLDAAFLRTLLDDGAFMNDVPGRFTQGWGVRPQDVASWFETFGIETVALAASEGLVAGWSPFSQTSARASPPCSPPRWTSLQIPPQNRPCTELRIICSTLGVTSNRQSLRRTPAAARGLAAIR